MLKIAICDDEEGDGKRKGGRKQWKTEVTIALVQIIAGLIASCGGSPMRHNRAGETERIVPRREITKEDKEIPDGMGRREERSDERLARELKTCQNSCR